MLQLTIDKLIQGGQGMGRQKPDKPPNNDPIEGGELPSEVSGGSAGADGGKTIFAWNALPGEEVEVELVHNKKTWADGVAVNILKSSPHRISPREEHFLSCSPWQILSWEQENTWKQEIARETYAQIGGLPQDQTYEIVANQDPTYGYRNKMEYSFAVDEKEQIRLAFFGRGQHKRFAHDGCILAEDGINQTALAILNWIRTQPSITLRNLKSLIIRSNGEGQTIAALFLKDVMEFADYPVIHDNWLGFQLYHSFYKSPASVPTKLLYSVGQDFLITHLNQTPLKFGLLSFFQVNIPLFQQALTTMASFVDDDKELLDFYSGVGAIGLPLQHQARKVTLVDNNAEAIQYARDNIQLNQADNCEAMLSPAENVTELITTDKTLILDPPRAGLHDDVTQRIIDQKPGRILYMSCNVATHARDIGLLKEHYDIKFLKLFNFFPRTPHVESLCVLERK